MPANTPWNGYPPDPTVDGWHWLRHGELSPAYWQADIKAWSQGGLVCGGSADPAYLASDVFQGGVQYVGPCLMPAPYGDERHAKLMADEAERHARYMAEVDADISEYCAVFAAKCDAIKARFAEMQRALDQKNA